MAALLRSRKIHKVLMSLQI